MATLNDLEALLNELASASAGLTLEEFKTLAIGEIRQQMAGDKIYVPAVRVSKTERILEAARKLPAGIVSQRLGVSHSYVLRVINRSKN
jgi:hypothetical protein